MSGETDEYKEHILSLDIDSYDILLLTNDNTVKNKHIDVVEQSTDKDDRKVDRKVEGNELVSCLSDKEKSPSTVQFDLTNSEQLIKELRDMKYFTCPKCNNTFVRKNKKSHIFKCS